MVESLETRDHSNTRNVWKRFAKSLVLPIEMACCERCRESDAKWRGLIEVNRDEVRLNGSERS